jgi:phosphoglycolate phosphatase-like HAD superfamily hydrolase
MAAPLTIITDFDGTVCRLDVDWAEVRRMAGVARIGELWPRGDPASWGVVTAAEVAAATVAPPVPAVVEMLSASTGFAVISNNSADAIAAFLSRHPLLAARCRMVLGREELQGPKENEERFAAAYARCLAALGVEAGDVEYLGDQDYELALASRCGARVRRVHVSGAIEPAGGASVDPLERDA